MTLCLKIQVIMISGSRHAGVYYSQVCRMPRDPERVCFAGNPRICLAPGHSGWPRIH